MTVEINTETLAPEQQEQVSALAETLTDKELENKTIKWLSFYDPWHPTSGFGNRSASFHGWAATSGSALNFSMNSVS